AIGVIVAMYIYCRRVLKRHMLWVLDRVVIPVAFGAIMVRIGNFLNSEIVGTPTGSDFGVIFEKLGEDFARHPAQLYEAFGYVFVFLILMRAYWKTNKGNQLGYLFGLFLVLLWSVRFVVEFFKKSQEGFEDMLGNTLSTGQWLSIPFIIAGVYFMVKSKNKLVTNE
ncbi:MAG: prolipoprotein diacylglyceryl transferase, partial [Bacteroidota bacterium]